MIEDPATLARVDGRQASGRLSIALPALDKQKGHAAGGLIGGLGTSPLGCHDTEPCGSEIAA